MQRIILTSAQKQTLSDHAENEIPNESCAILFGSKNGEIVKVEKIFLTQNTDNSPVNFTISPNQRLEADRIEKESGLKIIGIFHSHPNSEAYPSDTDKKFMELNPEIWLIFSGTTKEFKAYTLKEEVLVEIE